MQRKIIKTENLILRPFRVSDYQKWLNALADSLPAQNKFDQGQIPLKTCTQKFFNKMIQSHKKFAALDSYYHYAVFHQKSGQLVGEIDFDILARNNIHSASFGYMIYNQFWGQSFGKKACLAAAQGAFKDLKLHRLEAATDLKNKRSIRLAKAIGMKKESLRKKYCLENGRWRDKIIFVLLASDLNKQIKRLT